MTATLSASGRAMGRLSTGPVSDTVRDRDAIQMLRARGYTVRRTADELGLDIDTVQKEWDEQDEYAYHPDVMGAPTTTPAVIIAACAEYFDVTEAQITSPARRRNEVAHARQVGFYLCRELTDLTLAQVGKAFNRDHTSVYHGETKIRALVKAGGEVAEQVRDLTDALEARARRAA